MGEGAGSPGAAAPARAAAARCIFLIFIAVFVVFVGFGAFHAARLRKRRHERAARVALASAEAAGDDAYFAADLVKADAAGPAPRDRRRVDGPRPRGARAPPRARSPHGVGAAARRFRPQGLAQRVRDPQRPGRRVPRPHQPRGRQPRTASSSASSRSCATSCLDRDGNIIKRNDDDDELTTLAEYWTLRRDDDRWILHSIEQDAEGADHLDAPIVASPWSDDARMHDDAVTELAVADAVPDVAIAEIVDVDYAGDARTQALDLSVVDGRFAPAGSRPLRGGPSRRGRRRSTAPTRRSSARPRRRRRTRCSTHTARTRASSCAGPDSPA